jgi:hypothetical protein
MVEKDNKFILYRLKILFIILTAVIIFIIPVKTISAAPFSYVPLDSWVYPAISRLETLHAFNGNDNVATNTLPLIRIEIAYLIDTALLNIQKGKIEFKDSDLTLMEKIVLEFHDELTSIDVKIVSIDSDIAASAITADSSDNWLYEHLNYFQERDILDIPTSRLLNTQMSRKDMAILLDEIIYQLQTEQTPISTLTDLDIEKLEALIIELNDELSFQGLKIIKLNKTTIILDNLKSTLKFSPYFTQKIDFHNPDNTSKLFSELGVKASATISENSAFYFDYSINADYSLESTGLASSQLNQAYIIVKLPSFEIPTPTNTTIFPSLSNIEIPSLNLQVGRDSMRWGPSYQGSLILSDNPPPFDMIKYSGIVDLSDFGGGYGNLNFTKFFSLLDPLDGEDRYFSGQRIEYKATPNLTLGLSETAIISQESSILFLNPLPFIPPYYLTRWIADVLGQDSEINSNVSVDMELNFHPGIKLYGEWMANDFILTSKTNPYPNRTGFLAGVYFVDPLDTDDTDFRIEYTHINNYVYFPTHTWQDYIYQGEYIGSPLGPDADQLYLEVTHQLSDKFNLSFSYTHERHGEGRVGIPSPSDPEIANENIFLSGIIEKRNAYTAGIAYDISPKWDVSGSVTLENIENKDNNLGVSENEAYLQMELKYQF